MRTAGASVPSHASVSRKMSRLLSVIKSFMMKVLFERERTFSTARLMFVLNVRSSGVVMETCRRQVHLSLGLGMFYCLLEVMTGMDEAGQQGEPEVGGVTCGGSTEEESSQAGGGVVVWAACWMLNVSALLPSLEGCTPSAL